MLPACMSITVCEFVKSRVKLPIPLVMIVVMEGVRPIVDGYGASAWLPGAAPCHLYWDLHQFVPKAASMAVRESEQWCLPQYLT
jgi:hypothetical protein